jgi:signal transduction histidine kinase
MIDTLDPTVCIALFRITQEAINNAVRHAQADQISVALVGRADRISIEVRDDGIGVSQAKNCNGTGIDNMKTRARLISAQFSIVGGRGVGGTVVEIYLPLDPVAQGLQLEVGE